MSYLLLIIGILLIFLNLKAIKKDKNSFDSLVKENGDKISDFDVAAGELRREFSETILELQKEIYELKEALRTKKENDKNDNNGEQNLIGEGRIIEEKPVKEEEVINPEETLRENNNFKINEIEELLRRGISMDEICSKYNIGKGEVLLIKDLYLR
jgi:hypothetical protein